MVPFEYFYDDDLDFVVTFNLISTIIFQFLRIFSAVTCFILAKVGLLPFNKYLCGIVALLLPHISLIIAGLFPVKNYKPDIYL